LISRNVRKISLYYLLWQPNFPSNLVINPLARK
jgi:uncharacterized integral membrane protein